MKFGLHYNLQAVDGNWARVYRDCLEEIVTAEKLGFDSTIIAEHHFTEDGVSPSPNVVCAAIGALTARMRIGPGVLLLPLHNPIEVAEQAAVLDNLTNGRLILGVGLGNRLADFEGYSVNFSERKRRMEESLQLLGRLLSEEEVTFSGRHFKANKVTVTPRPVQKPRPPIWIGAEKSENAVKRAAQFGDAWIPSPLMPRGILKRYVKVYEDEVKSSGKDLSRLERPLRKDAYVSSDASTAWEEAKVGILNMYYKDYLKWGAIVNDDGRPVKYGEIEYDGFLEIIRDRVIIGGPDDFISAAERIKKEYHANNIILRLHFPGLKHENVMKAMRLIHQHAMPYFENEDP